MVLDIAFGIVLGVLILFFGFIALATVIGVIYGKY